MSFRWWLNAIFNKSWDKSLMIGYNLERFTNSPANLEHVTLYFDILIWRTKMEHCQWFCMEYFYSIVNTCASEWTCYCKLKLKLVRPERKQRVFDVQTHKNANPAAVGTQCLLLACPKVSPFIFRTLSTYMPSALFKIAKTALPLDGNLLQGLLQTMISTSSVSVGWHKYSP